jgi:DNA-binding PucR family transcriptional regulator
VSSLALSFARSEEALNRSREHVRRRLVREILDGAGEALTPADLVSLDYPLHAWHVAVSLPGTTVTEANKLVVELRAEIGYQHSLVYPVRSDSCVLWVAANKRWSEARLGFIATALEAAGRRASISDALEGLAGFLEAVNQVREVDSTRSRRPDVETPPVLRYSGLRLEILLLQNPRLAADFVRRELGPLAEYSPEAARLRATLEASFRLRSHVATAEHLQLHEHTVRNRLQKAEELLGPLHERRTELQVALRLWRVLAGN